jgi:glycosyltransferase involved in cell wall biosynthesis
VSTRPHVSVVVPLYNKRATIRRTVESILAQTYADFELLIIDDGSTDGGPDLIEQEYMDTRLRVIRQENAGPAAARNHGAEVARGDLITFLDADDEWRAEMLERAVTILSTHPECDAFTAAFYLEPAGVSRWDPLLAYGFAEGPWRLTPQIPRDQLTHCLDAFHPTTAVYRREVVLRHGGFFTEVRCTFGEDVYFWIQVLLNHVIYRHMEPLAHYHTEDSELGIGGRKGALPLEPVLTHPTKVRASAPPELKDVLELWLARHATRAAFMQLDRGGAANAAWLLRSFPLIRTWPTEYLKLRIRMLSPTLWNSMRDAIRSIRR